MYRYLSSKAADYTTAVSFSKKPTSMLPQSGKKTQLVHEFDDGSISVVGLSSASYFDIKIKWEYIPTADHSTLMALYHDSAKADGMRKTWYLVHPFDGKTYTVRFLSALETIYDVIGNKSISMLSLRVEGNKPA